MALLTLVFTVGLLSGFIGGMTGIGGALIAVPLLLFLPPLLHLPDLSVHAITGLAMAQGLATNLIGVLVHRRAGFVSAPLVGWTGSGVAIGVLMGSIGSRWLPARILLIVVGIILLFCGGQMFRRLPSRSEGAAGVTVIPALFFIVGGLVGLLGGATGLGTGSLLLVSFIYGLKVPIRVTVGSIMGISLIAAVLGTFGKAISWQLSLPLALSLGAGAVIGAFWGASLSHRLPVPVVRKVLAAVIALAALHILWKGIH